MPGVATTMEAAVEAAKKSGILELPGKSSLDATRKGYKLSHDEFVALFDAFPTEIRRLDLSNSAFGDSECGDMARLLSQNSTLTELILAGTDITGAAVQMLAEVLKENSTLKVLSLRGCKVGGCPGVQALASALQTNTGLESLDIGEMDLDISALIQFRIVLCGESGNKTLRSICLDRPVRGPNMRPMLDDGAEDIAGHVADLLRQNSTLERLSLRKCSFTDAAAAIIAAGLRENRGLKSLNLGCNKIGRDGAEAIADALGMHTSLEALLLDFNQIQDEGVVAICSALLEATAPTLQVLDVASNGVLGTIAHKTGHLYESGVAFLAQTAQEVSSLTEFRVWGNPAVSGVGQLDHEAARVVAEVLGAGGVSADVRPYEVDGLWRLAQAG